MWQSLQLNLPDTPIRDLVLKNDDIVLGSHGRGFWIMDDIAPFREAVAINKDSKVTLFKPANPIRGIYNAQIQYYLPDVADSVTIEIMDAQGNLIKSYTGKASKAERGAPGTAKGLNSFTWDMRYPGATTFEGMIIWSARPQRGPMAPIGEYQVKLTTGGESLTTSFNLEMNPNYTGITAADLQEQFDLAIQIRDKTSEANEAVILIREIREKMQPIMNSADRTDRMEIMMEEMRKIEEDLYQVKNQSPQDPLNFPIKLNNRLASLRRSIENGQAKPTDAAYVVFKELSDELAGHMSKLNTILGEMRSDPRLGQLLED